MCAIVALASLMIAAPRPASSQRPQYEILAARYATVADFPLRSLLPDAPRGETLDIAMAIWVIRDGNRVVLFDSGFFRDEWRTRFNVRQYVRPDSLLERIGIEAGEVTDVIVSHAHWDHMGGIALFPRATIWIQKAEYAYYTGDAWQPGGNSGGIDRADIAHLVQRNLEGTVRLLAGDSVEILPGIRVFTGARHTYASQYILVDGESRFVLASDNAYLFRNIEEGRRSATFSADDAEANVAAVRRMGMLAGARARVIPGHDAAVFERYPVVAEGVVRISPQPAGRSGRH